MRGPQGHSVFLTFVVVGGGGGGGGASLVDSGVVVATVVVVVFGADVEALGADAPSVVGALTDADSVTEVDERLVIQVDAGGSAFWPSSIPWMYTPTSTPVSADAATAKPHAAHTTRTADPLRTRRERQNSTA
ncbi:hypothetical protein ACQPW3_31915 [Actinosynnema sp. CA-248983]